MSQDPFVAAAFEALDTADAAVQKLQDGCCEPGRSPRMEKLAATLSVARTRLDDLNSEVASVDAVIEVLESAGEQVGRLQVGCCAPNRMPLYATALESLMKTERAINKSIGRGH